MPTDTDMLPDWETLQEECVHQLQVLEQLDRPVVDGEVLVVREGQGGRGQPMRCSLMGGLFVLLATRTVYQQLLLGIVYLKILILVVTF